ncbi:hypothetical protein C8R44DRAFT_750804 [Mycena epipterygia]|nr:hypothetical protein C8R44DRAFT_750804 [Mycena epipterygia]
MTSKTRLQGYGMIVLTSSYIPDITVETELSIKDAQTVELAGTDKTKAEYPVPMSLSIGVAPAIEKLSWGQSILKKLPVKSAAQTEESPISKLPVDDFKARGWDAKTERWRMPTYPSWGAILKQVTKDPADNLAKSKGKERPDPTDNLPKSKGKQPDPDPDPTDNLPKSKGKEHDPGLTTEETEILSIV